MANFELFKCNVCNRQTEKLIDQKRAPINKCTITYKCTGNLIKIGQSETKTLPTQTIDSNLVNWTPRGASSSTSSLTSATVLANINSSLRSLAIAVSSATAKNFAKIDIAFELQRITNATYIEYFYNRPSNTTLISGLDDSAKKVSLRFTTQDRLAVYVNGVQLDASGYDRSVLGRIVLKEALSSDTNQIRVLVYKNDVPSYITLSFARNDVTSSLDHVSAWGNVDKMEQPKGNEYKLFTCSDLSAVTINSRLIPVAATNNGTPVVGSLGYIVLADEPYSAFDRNLNNAISLDAAIANKALIIYKNDEKNIPKFYVDDSNIQSLFPPISITVKFNADVDTNKTSETNTKLLNAYIT